MEKDKTLIPPGSYCYFVDSVRDLEPINGIPRWTYKMCPYYKHREINGTFVPWCDYLNLGGTVGDTTDPEHYPKLKEHYKTDEAMDKELPLHLLFDQCKECGVNDEDELYKE